MSIELYCGDALKVMRTLPDNSIDLIATDPPYFRVKDEQWDSQWDKPEAFIAWLDTIAEQWARVLKPNGSVYCFASPRMAARVEVMLARRFNVLNNIRWVKERGWHKKTEKEMLRSYLSPWESVLFCEHYGSDNSAKGEAGYTTACDNLRGFIFEPLRKYLDDERRRAGLTQAQVNECVGTASMAGRHYFRQSQWCLPTQEHYEAMRVGFSRLNHGGDDLRREYDDLRRPFSVTADVLYTDVWEFDTVSHHKGKHPCEKPLAMMEHIICASSREGAMVLDCFMGSGTTGEAARKLGRSFIGIDASEHWVNVARQRLVKETEIQESLLKETG